MGVGFGILTGPIIIIITASLTIATLYFTVPYIQKELDGFRDRAIKELGTEDIEISAQDLFIARTKDGRQYPSEEYVNEYYRNKLSSYFGIIAGGAVMFTALAVWLSRGKKDGLEKKG